MNCAELLEAAGYSFISCTPLSGGDINSAFQVRTKERMFFLKLNQANRFPGMLEAEAKGLATLRANSSFVVPEVIQCGVFRSYQYLILEWLDSSSTGSWREAGAALAGMHKVRSKYAGLGYENYIGSLPQHNAEKSSWQEFYVECRLLPLLSRLEARGSISAEESSRARKACARLASCFPDEPFALLHGDLWSGNFMFCSKGAAVYDPAVYFGHREMDIGMTLLFGGFSSEFYQGYNEAYPLAEGWQDRVESCQLYPLLVHAVLFGGSYLKSVQRILGRFI